MKIVKTIQFLSILVMFSISTAFANPYVVDMGSEEPCKVIYLTGSESIQDVLKDLGLEGHAYEVLNEMPEDREDRKYWRIDSGQGKIKIDEVKKQEDIDKKAEKEAKKDAVLSKLKISKKDWEELTDKEVNSIDVA